MIGRIKLSLSLVYASIKAVKKRSPQMSRILVGFNGLKKPPSANIIRARNSENISPNEPSKDFFKQPKKMITNVSISI